MRRENHEDAAVETWLQTLGVTGLCEWDVLVFLHRHLICLVSGEHIARLLGYPTPEVVTALEALESLGLAERSRVDQGVRLYQLATPADAPRRDALGRLLTAAASRAGRLVLAASLRRGRRPDRTSDHAPGRQGEGRAAWRRAI